MMPPKDVEELFYPSKNLQRKDVPLPDFQYYYDRIHTSGSKVNISFCWLEYKEQNPHGYEKSQFYEYFNRFVEENYGGQNISMAVNRKQEKRCTSTGLEISLNFLPMLKPVRLKGSYLCNNPWCKQLDLCRSFP